MGSFLVRLPSVSGEINQVGLISPLFCPQAYPFVESSDGGHVVCLQVVVPVLVGDTPAGSEKFGHDLVCFRDTKGRIEKLEIPVLAFAIGKISFHGGFPQVPCSSVFSGNI